MRSTHSVLTGGAWDVLYLRW